MHKGRRGGMTIQAVLSDDLATAAMSFCRLNLGSFTVTLSFTWRVLLRRLRSQRVKEHCSYHLFGAKKKVGE
jgi:hypothetical protein